MDGTLALKKYKVIERLKALEEGGSYVLPVASDETLGGVKIGEGLDIDENGVLSASVTPYTPPDYSTSEVDTGMKWIDGKPLYRKVFTGTYSNVSSETNTLMDSSVSYETAILEWGFIDMLLGSQHKLVDFQTPDYCYNYLMIEGGSLYRTHKESYNALNGKTYYCSVLYTKATPAKSKSKKKEE